MYFDYSDLTKGIAAETLQVVSRSQENAENAIKEAIQEVVSYLSSRYDVKVELSKTGNSRNDMVVKVIRDVALYNCFSIYNPSKIPEIRRQKYEDSISFLKQVQAEKATLNLTRLQGITSPSSYVEFGSNPKRRNQF
jgi:phage gp36-like protein